METVLETRTCKCGCGTQFRVLHESGQHYAAISHTPDFRGYDMLTRKTRGYKPKVPGLDSPYITRDQLAEHFDVSKWTISQWIRRERIPVAGHDGLLKYYEKQFVIPYFQRMLDARNQIEQDPLPEVDQMANEGLSLAQVAQDLGIAYSAAGKLKKEERISPTYEGMRGWVATDITDVIPEEELEHMRKSYRSRNPDAPDPETSDEEEVTVEEVETREQRRILEKLAHKALQMDLDGDTDAAHQVLWFIVGEFLGWEDDEDEDDTVMVQAENTTTMDVPTTSEESDEQDEAAIQ